MSEARRFKAIITVVLSGGPDWVEVPHDLGARPDFVTVMQYKGNIPVLVSKGEPGNPAPTDKTIYVKSAVPNLLVPIEAVLLVEFFHSIDNREREPNALPMMVSYTGAMVPTPALYTGCPNIIRICARGAGHFMSFNEALAAITTEAVDNKYILVPSPWRYEENVILRPFIYITGQGSSGMSGETLLTSQSGVTLTVPIKDSGVSCIEVRSESVNPNAAAIKLVKQGTGLQTFFRECWTNSPAGARGVWADKTSQVGLDNGVIYIRGGIESSGGISVDLDRSAFFMVTGGIGNGLSATGVRVRGDGVLDSTMLLMGSVNINADPAAGLAVDLDMGGFFCLDANIFGAFNGFKVRTNSQVILHKMMTFGFPGTAYDDDNSCILMLGDNVNLEGPGQPPFDWWNVNGMVIPLTGTLKGYGTLAQRPAMPWGPTFEGRIKWWATNHPAPGAGCELTINAAGQWMDGTGVVVP